MNNEGCRYARTSKSNNTENAANHGSCTVLLSIWPFLCCPQVMKKSVIGADFEKKDAVPPYHESEQALKLKRRVSHFSSPHQSGSHGLVCPTDDRSDIILLLRWRRRRPQEMAGST